MARTGLEVYVLSDEDKARIQAEEDFRAKARADADAKVQFAAAKNTISPPKPNNPVLGCAGGLALSFLGVVAFFLVLFWIGGSRSSSSGIADVTPPAPTRQYQVTYRITSSCRASVTYTNQGGDTQQEQEVPSGWEHTFIADPGAFTYISGQLQCDGKITATLLVNGVPVKNTTSKGEYVIASASGRL